MSTQRNQSVDLKLPAFPLLPYQTEQHLFEEFRRIYDALNIAVQGLDDYTEGGSILETISAINAKLSLSAVQLRKQLAEIKAIKSEISTLSSAHFGLQAAYYRYTVPKFRVKVNLTVGNDVNVTRDVNITRDLRVTQDSYVSRDSTVSRDLTVTRNAVITGTFKSVGAAGFNGATPQLPYPLATVPATAPAGGVGTAAGGWDTAANRDAAIAAINNNRAAIVELQTALKNNGIGV